MTHELPRKYRPTKFNQVVGQDHVTSILLDMVKKRRVPHFLMFEGSTGLGKTTLGRIVINKLGCHKSDLLELNGASTRGIDDIRDKIEHRINLAPYRSGGVRGYILDEAHKLTNDAQNALLKILEEPPKHAYFVICTTTPGKLIPTIRNRAHRFHLEPVGPGDMAGLLERIAMAEKFDLTDDVKDKIIEVAAGSPRNALVLLDKILTLETEKAQLEAIRLPDVEKLAIDLVRLIVFNLRVQWKEVAAILAKIEEPEESVRHLVLSYVSKILLDPKTYKFHPRCYLMIQAFRDPWYDCGKPGLLAACFEVVSSK